jgi:hypothetical protein
MRLEDVATHNQAGWDHRVAEADVWIQPVSVTRLPGNSRKMSLLRAAMGFPSPRPPGGTVAPFSHLHGHAGGEALGGAWPAESLPFPSTRLI